MYYYVDMRSHPSLKALLFAFSDTQSMEFKKSLKPLWILFNTNTKHVFISHLHIRAHIDKNIPYWHEMCNLKHWTYHSVSIVCMIRDMFHGNETSANGLGYRLFYRRNCNTEWRALCHFICRDRYWGLQGRALLLHLLCLLSIHFYEDHC